MNTDKITTVLALVFASDAMKNAIVSIQADGFTFDSSWGILGAIAAALWGFFTNKSAAPTG